MPRTIAFHYHFAPDAAMQDATSMQHFLTALVDLGYFVQGMHGAANHARAAQATAPGIAPTLSDDLRSFADGTMSTLWLQATPQTPRPALNSIHYGIAFHPPWHTGLIALTLTTAQFLHQPGERLAVRDHWLTLFTTMCAIWKIHYAHSAKPTSTWPEPRDDDLDSGRLTYLYDLNYLGASLVDQIGSDRLLAAPAWRAQSLSQGGILLIPHAIFDAPDPQRWQRVMRHLAITDAFTGLLDEE